MKITTTVPNKKFELENTGTITVLKYAETYSENTGKDNKVYLNFGADIIFKFEPVSSFGKGGSAVTFVQIVSDSFNYSNGSDTVYTWPKNRAGDFDKRNYDASGNNSSSKDIALNYSVDQAVSTDNYDFRYPEKRTISTVSLSNQDTKVSALYNIIKDNSGLANEYNLSEIFALRTGEADKKKKIAERLNSNENVVPYVVYSGKKEVNQWKSARMSDSPLTVMPKAAASARGEQHFETLILYEENVTSETRAVHKALCTVYWGWRYDGENKRSKCPDIEVKEGLPEHWTKAAEQWNAYVRGNNGFLIPAEITVL